MVTNQVMVRQMGEYKVLQRTKDGMFNATEFLKQWNSENPQHQRNLDNFWKSTNIVEFMSEVAENELNFKSVDFTELKNSLSTTTRGKHNGGTWMTPFLFFKFAMYVSPKFEYQVIKFVYDKMIEYRNESGEAYKDLSTAVQKLVGAQSMRKDMKKVAEALNWIVFGSHESQMRNKHGEEALQKELFELEKKVASLINEGFIRNYDHLIEYLRQRWREKNTPKCFER